MTEEVHSIEFTKTFFHAGKNFGTKVEVKKVPGLTIKHDATKKLFYATYKTIQGDRLAVLPEASVFMWEAEKDGGIPLIKNEHVTQDVTRIKSAQVSTPMGHVFEGPGKGKAKR